MVDAARVEYERFQAQRDDAEQKATEAEQRVAGLADKELALAAADARLSELDLRQQAGRDAGGGDPRGQGAVRRDDPSRPSG